MDNRLTRRALLRRAGIALTAPAAVALLAACGPAAPVQPTSAPPGPTAAAVAPATPAPAPAPPTSIPGAAAPTSVPKPAGTRAGGGVPLTLLWWQAPTILNAHLSLATKDIGAVR